jgi:hypothetical protein
MPAFPRATMNEDDQWSRRIRATTRREIEIERERPKTIDRRVRQVGKSGHAAWKPGRSNGIAIDRHRRAGDGRRIGGARHRWRDQEDAETYGDEAASVGHGRPRLVCTNQFVK